MVWGWRILLQFKTSPGGALGDLFEAVDIFMALEVCVGGRCSGALGGAAHFLFTSQASGRRGWCRSGWSLCLGILCQMLQGGGEGGGILVDSGPLVGGGGFG